MSTSTTTKPTANPMAGTYASTTTQLAAATTKEFHFLKRTLTLLIIKATDVGEELIDNFAASLIDGQAISCSASSTY